MGLEEDKQKLRKQIESGFFSRMIGENEMDDENRLMVLVMMAPVISAWLALPIWPGLDYVTNLMGVATPRYFGTLGIVSAFMALRLLFTRRPK